MNQSLCWVLSLLATLVAATGQEARRFDFGPADQAVAPGFIGVDHRLIHTPERGYGWEQVWGMDHAAAGDDPLLADGIGGRDVDAERQATFVVDLPPGLWWATVWLGVQSPREGRFGQCVEINGKVLLPPPGVGGWGKTFERRLPVAIEGGQARVRFFVTGKSPTHRLSLLGVAFEPVAAAEAAGVRLAWDDAPGVDEVLGRSIVVGNQTLQEVGRRREVPLGTVPDEWRDDALLAYTRPNPGDILDYSIPRPDELTRDVVTFACPGDVAPLSLGVYAVHDVSDVRLGIGELTDGALRMASEQIDVFTVTCHPQSPSERPGGMARIMPELLEKRWPFSLAAGRTQPLYIRVTVPLGQAPGTYRGTLTLAPAGQPALAIRLTVRVLPITLQTPPDKIWHLYTDSHRWFTMSRRDLEREIDDLLAHGINSFSGAYPPLSGAFIEQNGRIVDADLGRFEEGLRYAVSRGYRGPVMLGATNGLLARFRGWSVDHRGKGRHRRATGDRGQCLELTHAEAGDTSSVSQVCGTLLSPGASVRFAMRYRVEGDVRGQLGLRFMKSYKRDVVTEGRIQLPIEAGEGWQTAWGVTTVPADAPYAQVVGDFSGTGRLYLDDIELTIATAAQLNYVTNPGFERDFAPVNLDAAWPADFTADYQDAVRALTRVGERLGLPVYIVGTDEAGNDPASAAREIGELRAAHQAGARTWCNLAPYLVERLDGILDAVCFYGDMLGSETECRQLLERERRAGRQLYTITSGTYENQDAGQMPNRYGVGFFFWRAGIDGTGIWTYHRAVGDPFDDFDGPYRDHFLVYPPREPGGEPIPTLAWEGIREGWKDYRYAYTLELAVARAREDGRATQAARGEAVLQFIRDTVPWYSEFDPARFDDRAADRLRWMIAWTLLQMADGDLGRQVADSTSDRTLGLAFADGPARSTASPYLCPVTAVPPAIDGRLDDTAWAGASRWTGFERHTSPGVKAEAQTTVLAMHDTANLYLGFICEEPAMAKLKAETTADDGNVFADDSLEIFLDTRHNAFDFLQLCFNAAGTQADIRCAGGYNYGNNIFQVAYGRKKERDQAWNGEWQVVTSRHQDRWEAEVVLPFATIGRDSDLIGFFVGRNRRGGGAETSSLTSIGFFHQPERYPSLLLAGARNGAAEIERLAIPVGRAGRQRATLTLKPDIDFRLGGEVRAEGASSALPPVASRDGRAELAYLLPAADATVALNASTVAGEPLYRFAQPASPPPILELLAGERVLAPGATGAFRLAVRLSEIDRAVSTLTATVTQDGAQLATANLAVAGETAELTWDTAGLPAGFYSLSLTVAGPSLPPVARLDLPIAIVPTFADLVHAP